MADNRIDMRVFLVRVILMLPERGPARPVRFSDMDIAARVMMHGLLESGAVCKLPDGCFAEGVKEFSNEVDAHAAQAKLQREYPDEAFRVILTSANAL